VPVLKWPVSGAFAEHFTVYTLDLPGFGYSDKPPGYGTARRTAGFVQRFLATLQLERVTLVGHSMGGTVALWLAAEHPARVERLVLVDVAQIGRPARVFRLLATPLLGDLLLRVTTPGMMRWLLLTAYAQKQVVTPDMAVIYARFLHAPGARQALIAHARAYAADKRALLPRLGAISVPALVVWGDRDPFFPLSVARELQQRLGGAHLEVIANAGHVPQEEQPEQFQQPVLQWLTSSRREVHASDKRGARDLANAARQRAVPQAGVCDGEPAPRPPDLAGGPCIGSSRS
jgi:pimeloyl-ACP methyl ester carboxylesterase